MTATCSCGGVELEAFGRPIVSSVCYCDDCRKGAELLKSYKLKESSVTNRVVAACCNSAMFMSFDRGPHWVSAYRVRFHGELPPLQLRICTKFKPDGVVLPDDVPSHRGYPQRTIGTCERTW